MMGPMGFSNNIPQYGSLPALLALADGSLFWGKSIGILGQTQGEVVFNTSMTGYQEMLTDLSYMGQILTLTYPHIGNVGTNPDDRESSKVAVAGLVIRDLTMATSNWRSTESLADYLKNNGIVAIADIDTRRLTRLLRQKGAQNGCIIAGENIDPKKALELAQRFPGLNGVDLTDMASTPEKYTWTEGTFLLDQPKTPAQSEARYHVVAYDFGIKENILRLLVDAGCRVTVVPARTSVKETLALKPNGVFLSNGPGDPAACVDLVKIVKGFLDANMPLFGICLGHQLLALAVGAKTLKMKLGHHGANHPVCEIATGKVFVTTQNHGFSVDEASLPSYALPTHRSLFDGTLQGLRLTNTPAFGFQGHPEASGGPHDIQGLFQEFVALMAA
jgi:carbamoyl-phosphate synthase small subunit